VPSICLYMMTSVPFDKGHQYLAKGFCPFNIALSYHEKEHPHFLDLNLDLSFTRFVQHVTPKHKARLVHGWDLLV